MQANLWTHHDIPLDALRQAIPGGPNGWCPNRIIFRDWWHWRDHELGFAHGRLALTGQNSGGKSSIMALVIPSLLDGDTSPVRLDPSLTRDRHLYWYLLGEDDLDPDQPGAFAYRSRIGYLALEFCHPADGFITIGMGVSADRGAPRKVRDWCGFVIEQARLGHDFDLRDDGGNCLLPREFLKRQEPPGFRTMDRGEYRRRVNATLFGMSDDDYQALIGMLLQARRPRLGEQAGPETVCGLLVASLPGIPGHRLERVAEVVQNIESHERNLADVTARADAVAELDSRLQALAEVRVQRAATLWAAANGRVGSYGRRLADARTQLSEAEQLLTGLERELNETEKRQVILDARLQAFSSRDEADLPNRMQDALGEVTRLETVVTDCTRLMDERQQVLDDHVRCLSGLGSRFRRCINDLVELGEDILGRAREVGWTLAERFAERFAERLSGLSPMVTDLPPELCPDAALEADGTVFSRSLRTVLERLTEQERTRQLYDQHRERMDELRRASEELNRKLAAAEDRAAMCRDELVTALDQWRPNSPGLDAPDHLLATLSASVRELETSPPDGYAELIAPLRRHADSQRRWIESERRDCVRRAARIELELGELDHRADTISRGDLLWQRSPVRESARTDPSAAGLPLFRWIRFRPGVDAETMARVEAAAVEAGLLDLLLVSQPNESGDAWLVPRPLADGPTLLDIMEPEPGAPEDAGRALASVAWGESSASRWISADGRWRNGLAYGRVMPWLTEAVGIVGTERRQETVMAGLNRLAAIRERLEAELAAAGDQERLLSQRLSGLDSELEQLGRLPWQGLFTALDSAVHLSGLAAEADARIEAASPELDRRLREFNECEAAYGQAVGDCPAARGLTTDGLRTRITSVAQLAEVLAGIGRRINGLTDICADHRDRRKLQDQDQKMLDDLRLQAREYGQKLEAAAAGVRALQERMREPSVAALQEEIEKLTRERDESRRWRDDAIQRRAELRSQRKSASDRIEDLEPEEAIARADAAARLDDLKESLSLHPALTDCAQMLEREGPVTAQRRLPRPVEPDEIEREIDRLRGSVQEFVQRHRDLLGDYRPTPSAAWETVGFTLDRSAVTAGQLFDRLTAQQDQYRNCIADEERELYQRIIYHGILDDLRQLIGRAREFTRRTNDRLSRLKLSSGETLSLRLSAGNPEQVPGTRIGQALESMDQSSDWLADEQREVILGLIRDEIERSRREALAQDREFSYPEAITATLDYRNWFGYQIMSLLPGRQSPSPIRKRGFGRRSTSARAWALAVPIIAAVAARCDAATVPGVPRLIALDEAFAGFDHNNQIAYLRFLSGLNLNWIITCPDELPYDPSLTAAMAYRMELDGLVHTAFPILWDGTRAREPLGEALDEAAAAGDWAGGAHDD